MLMIISYMAWSHICIACLLKYFRPFSQFFKKACCRFAKTYCIDWCGLFMGEGNSHESVNMTIECCPSDHVWYQTSDCIQIYVSCFVLTYLCEEVHLSSMVAWKKNEHTARFILKNRCLFFVQVPKIDSSSVTGLRLENLIGNVEFRNISFNYPSRPDVKVCVKYLFVL